MVIASIKHYAENPELNDELVRVLNVPSSDPSKVVVLLPQSRMNFFKSKFKIAFPKIALQQKFEISPDDLLFEGHDTVLSQEAFLKRVVSLCQMECSKSSFEVEPNRGVWRAAMEHSAQFTVDFPQWLIDDTELCVMALGMNCSSLKYQLHDNDVVIRKPIDIKVLEMLVRLGNWDEVRRHKEQWADDTNLEKALLGLNMNFFQFCSVATKREKALDVVPYLEGLTKNTPYLTEVERKAVCRKRAIVNDGVVVGVASQDFDIAMISRQISQFCKGSTDFNRDIFKSLSSKKLQALCVEIGVYKAEASAKFLL
jgi:hypothetical protein